MSVVPQAGAASIVAIGSTAVTAVTAVPAGVGGGFITNPLSDANQGVTAEVLYVNPVGAAGVAANGTTFALQPGQTWSLIPGQTTATSVNALSDGHKFSVVWW